MVSRQADKVATLKEKPSSTEHGDLDRRWQAVLARAQRSDGAFVYAVRSTGVYCQPSCPSRRPKREQVVFFPGPDAAERAGFRHCRRCRPGQHQPTARPLEIVNLVCRYIQNNQDGPPTLVQLSSQAGASPGYVHRVFKRLMGITPRQYADACRRDRFKARLKEGWDVTGAMYDAGYGSTSHLYEGSTGHLGMSPASYRRGGQGASIIYTIVACPLGRLLVAATERGLCAVKLGGSNTELDAELRQEFLGAHLHPDDGALGESAGALVRHLNGDPACLDLPLDIRATAFQRQVWEYLRTIPYGETRSYQQVADAVGRACGANPVPLVVPCHRVVKRDGGLGGYRWGQERKAALLGRERPAAEAPTPRAEGAKSSREP